MGSAHEVVRGPWFRAQDSNLRFWIQRPASCRLDDPGESPRRATEVARRSSRSGGIRTLTTSIKSRVRLPIALRTRDHAHRTTACTRGWDARDLLRSTPKGTLIPRGKSPVLVPIELASRTDQKELRLIRGTKPQIPSLRNMIEPPGQSRIVRRTHLWRAVTSGVSSRVLAPGQSSRAGLHPTQQARGQLRSRASGGGPEPGAETRKAASGYPGRPSNRAPGEGDVRGPLGGTLLLCIDARIAEGAAGCECEQGGCGHATDRLRGEAGDTAEDGARHR